MIPTTRTAACVLDGGQHRQLICPNHGQHLVGPVSGVTSDAALMGACLCLQLQPDSMQHGLAACCWPSFSYRFFLLCKWDLIQREIPTELQCISLESHSREASSSEASPLYRSLYSPDRC